MGVVADDGRVDEEREQRVLVRGRVLFEERGGVVVADGGVFRPGGLRGCEESEEGEELVEHCEEGSGSSSSSVCGLELEEELWRRGGEDMTANAKSNMRVAGGDFRLECIEIGLYNIPDMSQKLKGINPVLHKATSLYDIYLGKICRTRYGGTKPGHF